MPDDVILHTEELIDPANACVVNLQLKATVPAYLGFSAMRYPDGSGWLKFYFDPETYVESQDDVVLSWILAGAGQLELSRQGNSTIFQIDGETIAPGDALLWTARQIDPVPNAIEVGGEVVINKVPYKLGLISLPVGTYRLFCSKKTSPYSSGFMEVEIR